MLRGNNRAVPLAANPSADSTVACKQCNGKRPVALAVAVAFPIAMIISAFVLLLDEPRQASVKPDLDSVSGVMVIGGVDLVAKDSISDVEVVKLTEADFGCPKPNDYPIGPLGVHSSVGAVIGDRVLVCGGFGYPDEATWNRLETRTGYRSECHAYSFDTKVWSLSSSRLAIPRAQAASALLSNGLWMVVGGQGGDNAEVTSEILTEGVFVPGPSLPVTLVGHCMVNVNSSHVFVAGGRNFLPNAYLVSSPDFEWMSLPDMDQGRSWHVCGMLDGTMEVVVSGGQTLSDYHTIGFGDRGYLKTTEIYSVEDGTWRMGPELPWSIDEAASVQIGSGTFLVLGGQGGEDGYSILDKVYEFDKSSYEWVERRETLAKGRKSHTVIPLKGRLLKACDGSKDEDDVEREEAPEEKGPFWKGR